MYGHLNGTSHNLAPPGPPAAVTGNASWAYFERASKQQPHVSGVIFFVFLFQTCTEHMYSPLFGKFFM